VGDSLPIFLRVPELATALRVSEKQVYAWTRRRGPDSIPRIKLGRGYAFDLDDVVRWLKEYRDPRMTVPVVRGRAALPGRRRGVRARRRRRAPNRTLGGQAAATPTAASVSGDGPARVAFPLPSENPERIGGDHAS